MKSAAWVQSRLSIGCVLLLLLGSSGMVRAATAIFAGCCFWCVEALYQEQPGVTQVISGFTGGTHPNPTYSGLHTGHYEAVEVTYDASLINYQQLLDLFWHNIDPFDAQGQFCDKGPSYLSAIFVGNPTERELAVSSKQKVAERFSGRAIATEILDASRFYPVEASHQDYYLKNPLRYGFYRRGCGRDARLQEIWGADAHH